jgi:hypothetical protein
MSHRTDASDVARKCGRENRQSSGLWVVPLILYSRAPFEYHSIARISPARFPMPNTRNSPSSYP